MYFVVDGHRSVATARRLGQAFLGAHVVDYGVDDAASEVQSAHGCAASNCFATRADDLVALWRRLREQGVTPVRLFAVGAGPAIGSTLSRSARSIYV